MVLMCDVCRQNVSTTTAAGGANPTICLFPCFHKYCERCKTQALSAARQHQNNNTDYRVACKICSQHFQLNVLYDYSESQIEKIFCLHCNIKNKASVEWRCKTCQNRFLCTQCSQPHYHSGHEIEPVMKQNIPLRSQCNTHINVPATYLCSCQMRLCDYCLNVHAHGQTTFPHEQRIPFTKLAEQARNELEGIRRQSKADSKRVLSSKETIGCNKQTIHIQASVARSAVANEVLELVNAVIRRGNDIVTYIDMVEENRLKYCSQMELDIRQWVERLKKIESFTENALLTIQHDQPGMWSAAMFAQSALSQVNKRRETAKAHLKSLERPPNIIYQQSDLAELTRALRSFGIVSVDGEVKIPAQSTPPNARMFTIANAAQLTPSSSSNSGGIPSGSRQEAQNAVGRTPSAAGNGVPLMAPVPHVNVSITMPPPQRAPLNIPATNQLQQRPAAAPTLAPVPLSPAINNPQQHHHNILPQLLQQPSMVIAPPNAFFPPMAANSSAGSVTNTPPTLATPEQQLHIMRQNAMMMAQQQQQQAPLSRTITPEQQQAMFIEQQQLKQHQERMRQQQQHQQMATAAAQQQQAAALAQQQQQMMQQQMHHMAQQQQFFQQQQQRAHQQNQGGPTPPIAAQQHQQQQQMVQQQRQQQQQQMMMQQQQQAHRLNSPPQNAQQNLQQQASADGHSADARPPILLRIPNPRQSAPIAQNVNMQSPPPVPSTSSLRVARMNSPPHNVATLAQMLNMPPTLPVSSAASSNNFAPPIVGVVQPQPPQQQFRDSPAAVDALLQTAHHPQQQECQPHHQRTAKRIPDVVDLLDDEDDMERGEADNRRTLTPATLVANDDNNMMVENKQTTTTTIASNNVVSNTILAGHQQQQGMPQRQKAQSAAADSTSTPNNGQGRDSVSPAFRPPSSGSVAMKRRRQDSTAGEQAQKRPAVNEEEEEDAVGRPIGDTERTSKNNTPVVISTTTTEEEGNGAVNCENNNIEEDEPVVLEDDMNAGKEGQEEPAERTVDHHHIVEDDQEMAAENGSELNVGPADVQNEQQPELDQPPEEAGMDEGHGMMEFTDNNVTVNPDEGNRRSPSIPTAEVHQSSEPPVHQQHTFSSPTSSLDLRLLSSPEDQQMMNADGGADNSPRLEIAIGSPRREDASNLPNLATEEQQHQLAPPQQEHRAPTTCAIVSPMQLMKMVVTGSSNPSANMTKNKEEQKEDTTKMEVKNAPLAIGVRKEEAPPNMGQPKVLSNVKDRATTSPSTSVSSPAPGGGRTRCGSADDMWDDYCYICGQGCDETTGSLGCCETCPHVFHANCHVPKIGSKMEDLPDDWRCVICQGPYEPLIHQTQEFGEPEKLLCAKVYMVCFEENHQVEVFLNEVPRTEMDYHAIIKQPIWLYAIAEKISSGRYENVSQFIDDMNLLFKNFSTFNPPNVPLAASAKGVYARYVAGIRKYLPAYLKQVWLYISNYNSRRGTSVASGDEIDGSDSARAVKPGPGRKPKIRRGPKKVADA